MVAQDNAHGGTLCLVLQVSYGKLKKNTEKGTLAVLT